MELYHSPYHGLPQRIRNNKQITSFQTVHDIIPVLHPELFGLPQSYISDDFDKEYNLLDTLSKLDRKTWVTCPSHSTKNDLCNYLASNIDAEKISVTPWAASNLFYPCRDQGAIAAMRQKYSIPDGPYILCLGTLEPRKNLVHLIRCFAQLTEQENIPDLSLVLAGATGWRYEPIFREIEKSKKSRNRTIRTGFIDDEYLAALYSDALVFVYPSLYEGFGLPPLEAMQCGTPVITPNTSSLPEVVGSAGIMIDPLNEDELCHNILRIYRSSPLRQNLSKKSIEQARQFSWPKCAQQTIAAYGKALA